MWWPCISRKDKDSGTGMNQNMLFHYKKCDAFMLSIVSYSRLRKWVAVS